MNNVIKNNFSNEIQIEIDDVYACPGHCPGCVLSSIEKKHHTPDMNFNILKTSIEKLKPYVLSLDNLKKINLTYGIADHFLMPNDYLNNIFHLGADLIEHTNLKNSYNGVFFTASMIGKHSDIINKVNSLYNESQKRNVPVYIIAVLDPKHLLHKKFSDIYKNNIIETNKILNKVDLSINLSEEAITYITPQELYEFALLNNFDEVTINWIPTVDNMKYVYFNQKKLAHWLIEFDTLISKDNKLSTSYRPVIMKTINNIYCKSFDNIDNTLIEDIKKHLPHLVKKSIQIDDKGNIFPKYEAIGDIPHGPRFGVKSWGNVLSELSILDIVNNGLFETEKFVTKQFVKQPCLDCEYNKFCANTGFHMYNYIINKNLLFKEQIKTNIKENNCYHTAKILFEYYKNQIVNS